MTAVYEKSDVRFMYPENWEITDEERVEWPRSVSLQSPGGGFWQLMIYEPDSEPAELTEQVVEAMSKEYESLEAAPHTERFADIEAAGYDMFFYCLDLVINSRAVAMRTGRWTLLLVWQAEDREFEQLEPVFRAITHSLLEGELGP